MSNLAPAVGFFVKVFEVLATSPTPSGISEISRRTEINKTMVKYLIMYNFNFSEQKNEKTVYQRNL